MQTQPASLAAAFAPAPARRNRLLFKAALAAALTLFAAGALLGWAKLHAYRPFAQDVFADPRAAPGFHLIDQNGRALSLEDLRGKVVLLTFGYTHCPNICPMTLANLNQAFGLLTPGQRAKAQVLFVSVDPKRDTQAQLLGYVPFYNPAFLGASASEDGIARVARAYGVFYAADPPANPAKPGSYNMTHSAYVYVIDQEGRLIAMYGNQQLFDSKKIADDLAYFAGR